MNVLWEEHGIGPFHNRPSYCCDEGGVIAEWTGHEFKAWREPKTEALMPPWSEPLEIVAGVALLRNLLGNSYARYGDTLERWPDAIVSYAWQGDRIQVAVIRTKFEEHTYAPDWYTTGRVPEEAGLVLAPAREYLIIEGCIRPVLWRIQGEGPLKDHLIWPQHEVQGVLVSPDPLAPENMTFVRGKILPLDVRDTIEVLERPGRVRQGMAGRPAFWFYAPEGFVQKQLIVRNSDGTWSPANIWVGEKLTYKGGGTPK